MSKYEARKKLKLGCGTATYISHGEVNYECLICGKKDFKDRRELDHHFEWEHPVEAKWLDLLSMIGDLEHYCNELCELDFECDTCPLSDLVEKLTELKESFAKKWESEWVNDGLRSSRCENR